MRNVTFKAIDDTFAFLKQCAERHVLGEDPKAYEYLCVSRGTVGPQYSISYEESNWTTDLEMAPLFGGAVAEGAAVGAMIHVNELLLTLPLYQQASRRGHVPSLLLGCRPAAGENRETLSQRLYQAWRMVPLGDEEESVFRFSSRNAPWLTVEVTSILPGFVFEEFHRKLPEGVTVFFPAWRGDRDCFLFVEAGFAHAKPVEFSLLYKADLMAERDSNGLLVEEDPLAIEHIVLLEPGPSDGVHRNGGLVPPRSHLLGTATVFDETSPDANYIEFSRSNEVYDLTVTQFNRWPEFIQSEPVGNNEFPVSLSIGPTSHSVGQVYEIEARIGRHQRAIEELQSRRSHLQGFREEDFSAVFVFEQPDPDSFPPDLAAFLKRPLSELDRYQYLRTPGPEGVGFEHCVISDIRMPVAQALSTPCSRLYLCQSRWWNWGLNLFLRADSSLNFSLEEPGLIRKIQKYVEDELDQEGHLGTGYLLAEPGGEESEDGIPIRFRILIPPDDVEMLSLSALLTFTNNASGGTAAIVEHATSDLESRAETHEVQVSEETREADDALLNRASDLTGHAENSWEEIRSRAQSIVTQARITDAALSATEDVYAAAPESWRTFVQEVLVLDRALSRARIDAFSNWYLGEAERAEQFSKIAELLSDVEAEVAEKREEFEERRRVALEQIGQMRAEQSVLNVASQDLRDIQQQYGELKRQLEGMVTGLEDELGQIAKEREKCERALQEAVERKAERETEEQELLSLQEELEDKKDALNDFELNRIEPVKTNILAMENDVEEARDRIQDTLDSGSTIGLEKDCDALLDQVESRMGHDKTARKLRKRLDRIIAGAKKRSFLGRVFEWFSKGEVDE